MIGYQHVKAKVYNIHHRLWEDRSFPSNVCLDANVLYFINYSGFETLRKNGGPAPSKTQQYDYDYWYDAALKEGVRFYSSIESFIEFVGTVEHHELLIDCLLKKLVDRTTLANFDAKEYRYRETTDLSAIRSHIKSIIDAALKNFALLPMPNSSSQNSAQVELWMNSFADLPDAALAASGILGNIPYILSDDQDLATIPNIHLFTANRATLSAASQAGRLFDPPESGTDFHS